MIYGLKGTDLFCCAQDPRVLDAMIPYLVNYYGNPHSRTHAYGWESEAAMEHARQVSIEDLGGSDVRGLVDCGRHLLDSTGWRWKCFGALSGRDLKSRPWSLSDGILLGFTFPS